MLPSEELTALTGLLRGAPTEYPLPLERQQELLFFGIIAALENAAAGSAEEENRIAVTALLRETAAAHPSNAVRGQAFQALLRLAAAGIPPAVDEIYRLATENELLAARQAISTRGWRPSQAALQALYDWFSAIQAGVAYPEEQLPLLTEAYLKTASHELRARLQSTAGQARAENWARMMIALTGGSEIALHELVDRYALFRPIERDILLDQLTLLAQQGAQPAKEAIIRLFIQQEETRARDIALQHRFLPEDSQARALFFFLAEDWAGYRALDFDSSLIVSAFESAGRTLRRRLLEHSRHTGQMDWMRGQTGVSEVRWLNDLTDADWDVSIRRLMESDRPLDLWRLAQVAPPIWSAAIFENLSKKNWRPQPEDERAGFETLANLAKECRAAPLILRPVKSLHAPITEITCLAMHPAGKLLAAGSSDQRISLWSIPTGSYTDAPIMGPAPVTRALVFSPDGEFIASANGDNRIRVFRTATGQLMKTFDGHSAMIRALAIHPDGRVLYSGSFDGTVRFWRFPHGAELKTLRPASGEIFAMALGVGGGHLLGAGADGLVFVWTLPEGALARELVGHIGSVTHLAASPTSELAASAGRDNIIRVWNYSSGGLLRTIPVNTPTTALAIHPNDQVLIGGSSSGEITLWNISTGRVIEKLTSHRKPITGLALSPSGDRLYSADAGATLTASLQVWDLAFFLSIRLPGEASAPGTAAALQERLKSPNLADAERRWLVFSAELARWRQRYDIELMELDNITVGEFDIELI